LAPSQEGLEETRLNRANFLPAPLLRPEVAWLHLEPTGVCGVDGKVAVVGELGRNEALWRLERERLDLAKPLRTVTESHTVIPAREGPQLEMERPLGARARRPVNVATPGGSSLT